jgi:hypothetical protein
MGLYKKRRPRNHFAFNVRRHGFGAQPRATDVDRDRLVEFFDRHFPTTALTAASSDDDRLAREARIKFSFTLVHVSLNTRTRGVNEITRLIDTTPSDFYDHPMQRLVFHCFLILAASLLTSTPPLWSKDINIAYSTIVSNLAGTDLVLFSTFHSSAGPRHLGVAKDIQSAAQLKGKKLAVSRFGSSSDFTLRFALRKADLDPEKDVAVLQIGNSPDRLAAMRYGQISGTMLTVEDRWAAEKFGFRTRLDVYDHGFEAVTVSAVSNKKYLTEQRDSARAFMRALVEAIHFTKTRRDETMKIMAKNRRISDPGILDQAYKFIAADYLQKPYPSIKGIQFTLQDLDRTKLATADLSSLRLPIWIWSKRWRPTALSRAFMARNKRSVPWPN